MIISPIARSYPNPVFQSTRSRTYDELGRVLNCNYTNFNREDMNWKNLAKFLDKRFQDQKRVRINFAGCSDGSEPYTLAIYLIKTLGNKSAKFFPIEASDISPDMVEAAKSGVIFLNDRDLKFIKEMGMSDSFRRDSEVKIMRDIPFYKYYIKESLRSSVTFSVSDVRKMAEEGDFSNRVFVFRNGWTFNSLEDQNSISKNLYKNSNEKTLVIIGQSDLFKSAASDYLQMYGFRGLDNGIFTGAETYYPSVSIGQPSWKPIYPQYILFEKGSR